jgi:hypothetical protein
MNARVRYLLQLSRRMARAALAVPLTDLDNALHLSAASIFMETYAASFPGQVTA